MLAETEIEELSPSKALEILSTIKRNVLAKLAHSTTQNENMSPELRSKLQYIKTIARPENLLYKRKLKEMGVQVSAKEAPNFKYYGQLPKGKTHE